MIGYLADLESDFSRFHRVDDIYELDGPRFFRLAHRISMYEGVMAMRHQELAQQQEHHAASPEPRRPGRASTPLAVALAPDPTVINWTPSGDWKQVS